MTLSKIELFTLATAMASYNKILKNQAAIGPYIRGIDIQNKILKEYKKNKKCLKKSK